MASTVPCEQDGKGLRLWAAYAIGQLAAENDANKKQLEKVGACDVLIKALRGAKGGRNEEDLWIACFNLSEDHETTQKTFGAMGLIPLAVSSLRAQLKDGPKKELIDMVEMVVDVLIQLSHLPGNRCKMINEGLPTLIERLIEAVGQWKGVPVKIQEPMQAFNKKARHLQVLLDGTDGVEVDDEGGGGSGSGGGRQDDDEGEEEEDDDDDDDEEEEEGHESFSMQTSEVPLTSNPQPSSSSSSSSSPSRPSSSSSHQQKQQHKRPQSPSSQTIRGEGGGRGVAKKRASGGGGGGGASQSGHGKKRRTEGVEDGGGQQVATLDELLLD